MASIANDPNGRRRLQFTDANGRRHTVRLGKIPKRTAEAIKTRIEHLVTAQISKQPIDGETSKWVASLDDILTGKLAKVGLIRQRESATLAAFIDAYITNRCDVEPGTVQNYRQARNDLVDFFGEGKLLRDVTPGDADDFRLHLVNQGLAENSTVRRRCGRAKQFFLAAYRKKLIPDNPFDGMPTSIQANDSRLHFVSREVAAAVLEACPDNQWRLIFALSRYGGLRCPSEHLALTWDCIDWEQNRIRVPSPKTRRYAGKDSRVIPIFPELRTHLEAAFDQAPEGTTYVIHRYRDSNSNLRTQLHRIIQRAGLRPWDKLFQNLRSTRETELAEEFPLHVVCKWLGNSQPVAAKHYLQVTDDHFQKATQNPTQTVHDKGVCDGQAQQETPQLSVPDNAGLMCTTVQMTPTGLEPVLPA